MRVGVFSRHFFRHKKNDSDIFWPSYFWQYANFNEFVRISFEISGCNACFFWGDFMEAYWGTCLRRVEFFANSLSYFGYNLELFLKIPPQIIVNGAENHYKSYFFAQKLMFANKNDLKDVTPMKNCNSDKKFLEFFCKIWNSLQ